MTDTAEPLIYTTKGNVPVSSLQHFVQWDKTEEYVKFTEVYKTLDGEVVKESSHVLALRTEGAFAEQAAMA